MSEKGRFNLGDPKFSRSITKVYSWLIPAIFSPVTLAFLLSGAVLSALLFLLVVVLTLPPLKEKIKMHALLRFVLCTVLTLAGMYVTGLYT